MKKHILTNLMTLVVIISFLLYSPLFAQITSNNLFSNKNRLAFGNHLFFEKDYLRAIHEFSEILNNRWSDTLQFKIALAYSRMDQFDNANLEFQKINPNSPIYKECAFEKFRLLFKSEKYSELQNKIKKFELSKETKSIELLRLFNSSLLLNSSELPSKNSFIFSFEEIDRNKIFEYYNFKTNPPYKSPTKAAIMSAIIPGLGKIYANEVVDGISAFLLTGLFTYLAVDKFDKQQHTSAWLYTALAAFFYSGNIYGSAAAVQNYNAGIKFNFENEVKLFINERNQFLPTPKFLCD